VTDPPTPPDAPPLVSVLVTAHDAEEQLVATLDSVLGQDYPAERLETIVVDDGSSDRTADLVEEYAACTPSRIQLVRQPHTGAAAALATALAQAHGEMLALLAAGATWPAGQISAQVATLQQRPELDLVYTELTGLAAEEPPDPPRGQPVARLLREDCVAGSSIALRRALVAELGPPPKEIARVDRWLLARAACLGEIDWVPVPREPSGTESDDERLPTSATAARVVALRDTLPLQRWFLRQATADAPYVGELGALWHAFARNARQLLADTGGDPFTELIAVSDGDRAEARRLLADAHEAVARRETWPATALAARAAAADPWCAPARTLLAELLAGRPRRVPADPLAGARRFVTLAFADELLADPQLLAAYGRTFDSGADATLAIDASALMPATAARALGGLVRELELDRAGSAHLLAVVGPIDAALRARLPAQADALLTRVARGTATPSFDDRSIAALRERAMHAPAA
jgi:hypothetical protein